MSLSISSVKVKTEIIFLGEVFFEDCYFLQKYLWEQCILNRKKNFVLVLIHQPCITAGRQTPKDWSPQGISLPVFYIERGGGLTYHGEGQLVIYFIWDIKEYGIKAFMDLLEDIIALFLEKVGIASSLIVKNKKGRGVWIKDKKVACLGIAIRKWVSLHGISINLRKDIHSGFNLILPCGLSPQQICCLEHHGILLNEFEAFKIIEDIIKNEIEATS